MAGRVKFTRTVTNGDPDNSVTDLNDIEAIDVARSTGTSWSRSTTWRGPALPASTSTWPRTWLHAADRQKTRSRSSGPPATTPSRDRDGAAVRVDGLAAPFESPTRTPTSDKLAIDTLAGSNIVTWIGAVIGLIGVSVP